MQSAQGLSRNRIETQDVDIAIHETVKAIDTSLILLCLDVLDWLVQMISTNCGASESAHEPAEEVLMALHRVEFWNKQFKY